MVGETKGLTQWVRRINQMEMPALASVIRELNDLTEDEITNADHLAKAILKDASITSQVLRVANSVQYNPTAVPVKTISKAAVYIGFQEVKTICLSVSVIDTLLKKNKNQMLLESIARSFHAAVQAKNIARNLSSEKREEVFIAALLLHLGEMAFYGVGGSQVAQFEEKSKDPEESIHQVCLEVLGVGFKTITKELVKEWSIGDLITQCLNTTKLSSAEISAVLLADAISRNVHSGIKSKSMQKLILSVAKLNGSTEKEAYDMVIASADEASLMAQTYGASSVCHLIPSSESMEIPVPDRTPAEYQLDCMQIFISMMGKKPDVNRVFQTLIKAMFKGVEFNRCVIAMQDANHQQLEARYAMGQKNLLQSFEMPVYKQGDPKDIFSWVYKYRKNKLMTSEDNDLRYMPLKRLLKVGECWVCPILYSGKIIAVFYADMEGAGISEKQCVDAKMLITQAQQIISFL
ncbi:MAG: HDOD domain-containing protein [Saccharospirillaceae bacterium]|nr:HDOD domain-containing protein [Pseudomonadales bacterium]NRB78628.1 HDOD domain-containing protein [Saccharospirillaceae bacterium]